MSDNLIEIVKIKKEFINNFIQNKETRTFLYKVMVGIGVTGLLGLLTE